MEPNRGLRYLLLEPTDNPSGQQRDVRGRLVDDTMGAPIGTVTGLVVDGDHGWVRFLVITIRSDTPDDGRDIAVPVDAIARLEPGRVRLDRTAHHVLGAPAFRSPDAAPGYWENVLTYYSRSSE